MKSVCILTVFLSAFSCIRAENNRNFLPGKYTWKERPIFFILLIQQLQYNSRWLMYLFTYWQLLGKTKSQNNYAKINEIWSSKRRADVQWKKSNKNMEKREILSLMWLFRDVLSWKIDKPEEGEDNLWGSRGWKNSRNGGRRLFGIGE